MSTVLRAHKIVILEGGGIAEAGERTSLQHDASSRFARLLKAGMVEELV
jgi:ABC-type multidrug transport system fused ATPase/permease subunit